MIWAVVFNKIFNFFGEDIQEENLSITPINVVDHRINFSKDTFNLKKIARDPFLGKYTSTRRKIKKSEVKPKNKKPKPVIKSNTNTPWPKMSYHGYVKGVKSTSELILIRINNKFHKVREGSLVDDVAIKKVYRDSILVKRNKESKIVVKSK